MIAFKGFNSDLTCTMGHGRFQYEIGKTYTEDEAKCAKTGFHCVEEPIEVLTWYEKGRYCIVEASGDIHEDGDKKISCTEMRIVKEINILELAVLECRFLQKHPDRRYSRHVVRNYGTATVKTGFVIVRGKNPKASGEKGTYLFLLKESAKGNEIEDIAVFEVDGVEIKENICYRSTGKAVRSGKKRA